MSYQISDFIQRYTPLVERLGFDENYADVTEMVQTRIRDGQFEQKFIGNVYDDEEINQDMSDSDNMVCDCGCFRHIQVGSQIASDIRESLKHELGISCCAGIAHNKLLAKLIGSVHKPNQQTSILPHLGCQFISSLSGIRSIPGIGRSTEKKLKDKGITTIWELQQLSVSYLQNEFGASVADTLSKFSFGIDDSPVIPYTLPQTLSDEDSFKCCKDLSDVKDRLKQLTISLLQRLKDDGRVPQTLRLTVRNQEYVRSSRQCMMLLNTFDFKKANEKDGIEPTAAKILPQLLNLFYKLVDVNKPFHLTLLNVCFSKFIKPTAAQNTLDSFLRLDFPRPSCDPNDIAKSDTFNHSFPLPSSQHSCLNSSYDISSKNKYNKNLKLNDRSVKFSVDSSPKIIEADAFIKHATNQQTSMFKAEIATSKVVKVEEKKGNQNTGFFSTSTSQASSPINTLKKLLPRHIKADELLQLPEDIQKDILSSCGVQINILNDGSRSYTSIKKMITRSKMNKGKQDNNCEIIDSKKSFFNTQKRKLKTEYESIEKLLKLPDNRSAGQVMYSEASSNEIKVFNTMEQRRVQGTDQLSSRSDVNLISSNTLVGDQSCSFYKIETIDSSSSAFDETEMERLKHNVNIIESNVNICVPTTLPIKYSEQQTDINNLSDTLNQFESSSSLSPSTFSQEVKSKSEVVIPTNAEKDTVTRICTDLAQSSNPISPACNRLTSINTTNANKNGEGSHCPLGMDPEVFFSLPSNIRGEILAHSALGSGHLFINNTSKNKKIQSGQKNLLHYFKKDMKKM